MDEIHHIVTSDGVEHVGTAAQLEAEGVDQALIAFAVAAGTLKALDEELSRRTSLPVEFEGHLYQADRASRESVATVALAALMSGGAAGDLRWQDPGTDFCWIADDNTLVPMDAPTMMAFSARMTASATALRQRARSLKDRVLGGEALDTEEDALWELP